MASSVAHIGPKWQKVGAIKRQSALDMAGVSAVVAEQVDVDWLAAGVSTGEGRGVHGPFVAPFGEYIFRRLLVIERQHHGHHGVVLLANDWHFGAERFRIQCDHLPGHLDRQCCPLSFGQLRGKEQSP